jgi:hypothetical protein
MMRGRAKGITRIECGVPGMAGPVSTAAAERTYRFTTNSALATGGRHRALHGRRRMVSAAGLGLQPPVPIYGEYTRIALYQSPTMR